MEVSITVGSGMDKGDIAGLNVGTDNILVGIVTRFVPGAVSSGLPTGATGRKPNEHSIHNADFLTYMLGLEWRRETRQSEVMELVELLGVEIEVAL